MPHSQPRLIHPCQVTVERLVRDEIIFDHDAREPIPGPRTTTASTVTLPAQVFWSELDDGEPQIGGVRELASGYILVRYVDQDLYLGSGQRLKRGDRIISMGQLTGLDLYIIRDVPCIHLPMGGVATATAVKLWFRDRHPGRQQGNL